MDSTKQDDTDINLMEKSIFQDEPKKAVFLPIYDLILNNYKGFVIDKEALPHLKYSDVWRVTKIMAPDFNATNFDRFLGMLLLIPSFPVILILRIITKLFKKTEWIGWSFRLQFARLHRFLCGKKPEFWTKKERRDQYPDAEEEDIPSFFAMCKERKAIVVLYSYIPLTKEQNRKLDKLISSKDVFSCQVISALSDLGAYIRQENISIANSKLVISKISERDEAEKLEFNTGYNLAPNMNVHIWDSAPYEIYDNLYKNARTTLNVFKHHIIPQ